MAYIPVDVNEAVRKECRRRRYSERTAKTYLYCVNKFLDWSGKELGKVSKRDVRGFLEHLSERGLSGNSMNTYHMAIRFLFEEVLDKRIWIDIKYSKVPERLPIVLTKEEVKSLFEAIENPKHKLMIELMYSAGLRVSELLNLRAGDLEINKGYGYVRSGKGGKDRLFILSDKLKERIKELIYNNGLSGDSFLFESNRNKKYDIRSVQEIIKKACRETGIRKKVHPHTLRHSFATHLIENGCSVSEVQGLLGHKSPETTMVYLHTATKSMINIRSPIDDL